MEMKLDPETEFMTEMMKLGYGLNVKDKLLELSKKIEWLSGWPVDNKAFWNGEAFMWSRKISKEKRALISSELNFLSGKNLDLGCGAYSYINSVGFDFSEKMLQFNDNCSKKVQGNLEEELPFNNNSFDSITAIFVLNYVKNYKGLLKEVFRVVKKDFVMVLFSRNVNDWQLQKQVNNFSLSQWVKVIEAVGFKVKYYLKDELWFIKCLR